jgi:hypothetical protein
MIFEAASLEQIIRLGFGKTGWMNICLEYQREDERLLDVAWAGRG